MDKLARVMEYFWLVLGFLSTGWAIFQVSVYGWDAGKLFVWFPMICFSMFFYRRFMRKKMAEWAARNEQEQRSGE